MFILIKGIFVRDILFNVFCLVFVILVVLLFWGYLSLLVRIRIVIEI